MKLFILREERHLNAMLTFLSGNWKAMADQGKPLAVEIKPEKAKRSLNQNAYYWQMLQQIAEQTWVDGRQYNADVWHEAAKRQILGLVDLPNGQTMGRSSATLSVVEFAEYIQQVEAWAASELGVQFVEVA